MSLEKSTTFPPSLSLFFSLFSVNSSFRGILYVMYLSRRIGPCRCFLQSPGQSVVSHSPLQTEALVVPILRQSPFTVPRCH